MATTTPTITARLRMVFIVSRDRILSRWSLWSSWSSFRSRSTRSSHSTHSLRAERSPVAGTLITRPPRRTLSSSRQGEALLRNEAVCRLPHRHRCRSR
jgi:hypothetical protein